MSKPKLPERAEMRRSVVSPGHQPALGDKLAVFDLKQKCSVIGTVVEINGPWITLEFEA
jgi:hypothetical protein